MCKFFSININTWTIPGLLFILTFIWQDFKTRCHTFRENPVDINHGKFQLWIHFPKHSKFHSVLDRKLTNLIQKHTIVCLSWNLVSILIRMCWTWWWYFLNLINFCFRPEILFLEKFCPKIKISFFFLKLNLVPRSFRMSWIRWGCSLFPGLTRTDLF